jgi:hypothetical protein
MWIRGAAVESQQIDNENQAYRNDIYFMYTQSVRWRGVREARGRSAWWQLNWISSLLQMLRKKTPIWIYKYNTYAFKIYWHFPTLL